MIDKTKTIKKLMGRLMPLIFVVFLAACNDSGPEGVEINPIPDSAAPNSSTEFTPPTLEPSPQPPTPLPPTPTPQLAALVNGQPILLSDFEKELARFELAQAELGIETGTDEGDYRQMVLNALVERELIRQAAVVQGLMVSAAAVDEKLKSLQESSSAYGNFNDWLIANQWTFEEFRKALEGEMLVEEMIAVVTADVPEAVEQVRVRYIQIDNLEQAQSLLAQIREGVDFAGLAQQYSLDQATAPFGGDLGYFARGSLVVPEIEAVAFDLQLDEVSDVITVEDEETGLASYFIVQLTERDPNRALGADLRYRLLQEKFESWLDDQKSGATITDLMDAQN